MEELYVGNATMKPKRNHIDYNKKNLEEKNLTSLCGSCHTKTNFNREYWQKYFTEKMEVKNVEVIKTIIS